MSITPASSPGWSKADPFLYIQKIRFRGQQSEIPRSLKNTAISKRKSFYSFLEYAAALNAQRPRYVPLFLLGKVVDIVRISVPVVLLEKQIVQNFNRHFHRHRGRADTKIPVLG